MSRIHPTAIVEDGARLGADIEIGPYCVLGPKVVLADRVRLRSHVVIDGLTTVGPDTEIYPFASIGHAPQDKKFRGEQSRLEIGAHTVIRESVTMNPGTEGGGNVTSVGDRGLFMAGAHVAHDCIIGDDVILANNATLGGHCVVGDHAILGGLSAVHQFVRIGAHAFLGGLSGVENDVIPFGMVMGVRTGLAGLNLVGMKRHGFSRESIHNMRQAYRMLFASEGTLAERVAQVATTFPSDPCVGQVLAFIGGDTSRQLLIPRKRAA